MNNKTILFTGGGTAGHVSPNLALIPYYLKNGYTVHYIGSKTGIENQMVKPPVIYHQIRTGKLRRYFDVKNFTDPFNIIGGYFDSLKLLKQIKPQIIFSKGGFVSVPVCMAAKHYNIPVILHESDFTPGLANKLCLPKAKVVCTSFQETLKHVGEKGVLTGTPIREAICHGNKEVARTFLNFDNKPTLMIMGGSLGAQSVNEAIYKIAANLTKKFNIIHICGKGNINNQLNKLPGYKQFEFLSEQLPDFIALCDVVVSRAGATAIFEFLANKKPMLLIPLPSEASRGDQILNAKYFEKQGFAKMIMQSDITDKILEQAISHVYANKTQYIQAMEKSPLSNSTQKVISIINENIK